MVKLGLDGGRHKVRLSFGNRGAEGSSLKHKSTWTPENENSLISQIATQPSPLSVTGGGSLAGSSFGRSAGTAISMERLSGLVRLDYRCKTATFWAGTLLSDVHQALTERGLALISSPDDIHRTLGEAVALAEHGSGRLGCLSAYVKSIRLVSPEGKVLECDSTLNPSLFQAARVDLGLLGVVSQITLYVRDRYRLKESIHVISFDQFLEMLSDSQPSSRHTECWVFPWADEVVVRQLEETLEPLTLLDSNWTTDDWFLKWLARLNQYVPADHLPWLKRLKWLVPHTQRIGWADDIIPPSGVRASHDLEYSVAVAKAQSVILDLIRTFRQMRRVPVFPLHMRWVARDDIWLSPFYGGDRVSISLLSVGSVDEVAKAAENVFTAHRARPSWSMRCPVSARSCASLYPKWVDFLMVRQSLDPLNKMINANLRASFFE